MTSATPTGIELAAVPLAALVSELAARITSAAGLGGHSLEENPPVPPAATTPLTPAAPLPDSPGPAEAGRVLLVRTGPGGAYVRDAYADTPIGELLDVMS